MLPGQVNSLLRCLLSDGFTLLPPIVPVRHRCERACLETPRWRCALAGAAAEISPIRRPPCFSQGPEVMSDFQLLTFLLTACGALKPPHSVRFRPSHQHLPSHCLSDDLRWTWWARARLLASLH